MTDCQGCAVGMHFLHVPYEGTYGPDGLIRAMCECVGECVELDVIPDVAIDEDGET